MKKRFGDINDIVLVGMFAAVVYGGQWLRISIPTPVGTTAINFGNIFCLLAGFMLGPVRGGLSAGIGSYVYNLTSPVHFTVLPFQLVFRFAHAFVCGLAAKNTKNTGRMYAAAAAGQVAYIILYFAQVFFWDGMLVKGLYPAEALIILLTAGPALASSVNGVVAVAASVPLTIALQKALKGKIRF